VHDTLLVLSFVSETRVLGMNSEDELDEANIVGFDAEVQVRDGKLTSLFIFSSPVL